MKKTKSPGRVPQPPLAPGQIWRMEEGILQVGRVGKLLVEYKLGRHNAIRVPNSFNDIKSTEKFLKARNAVLA